MLFTIDMYQNVIKKGKATINQLFVCTKVSSAVTIFSGVIIGTEGTDMNFSDLLMIGNGVLMALVPAYLGMFWHRLRALAVFIGQVAGIFTAVTLQLIKWYPVVDDATESGCAVCDVQVDPNNINPYGFRSRRAPELNYPMGRGQEKESYLWIYPAFYAFFAAVGATILAQYLVPKRAHDWFDKSAQFSEQVLDSFGKDRMSTDPEGKVVAELMEGANEPLKNPKAWPLLAFPFMTWLFMPFTWGNPDKEMTPVEETAGMPSWAFDFLMANTAGTICLVCYCYFFWVGREGEGDPLRDPRLLAGGKVRRTSVVDMPLEALAIDGAQAASPAKMNAVLPASVVTASEDPVVAA